MKMPSVPCGSCPYRRDVPSGVWDTAEYEKLPQYDLGTGDQAMAGALGVFMCHQQDGSICSGWAGCHDMEENLALRLAASSGRLTEEQYDEVCDYESPVPLWSSGAEAAEHGLRDVHAPGPAAIRTVEKVIKKLGARE